MESDLIGRWAFIVGIIIAVLAAFITTVSTSTVLFVLFILGLIIGALNITKKNTTEFLISIIALVMIGSLGALAIGQLTTVVGYLQTILSNFTVFVAAAALVVSLKTIIATSKK